MPQSSAPQAKIFDIFDTRFSGFSLIVAPEQRAAGENFWHFDTRFSKILPNSCPRAARRRRIFFGILTPDFEGDENSLIVAQTFLGDENSLIVARSKLLR